MSLIPAEKQEKPQSALIKLYRFTVEVTSIILGLKTERHGWRINYKNDQLLYIVMLILGTVYLTACLFITIGGRYDYAIAVGASAAGMMLLGPSD